MPSSASACRPLGEIRCGDSGDCRQSQRPWLQSSHLIPQHLIFIRLALFHFLASWPYFSLFGFLLFTIQFSLFHFLSAAPSLTLCSPYIGSELHALFYILAEPGFTFSLFTFFTPGWPCSPLRTAGWGARGRKSLGLVPKKYKSMSAGPDSLYFVILSIHSHTRSVF